MITTKEIAVPKIPEGRRRIVITGMPGSGKSSVGKMVAERLQVPFLDIDEAIERRTGKTVSEIFGKSEREFRKVEEQILLESSRLSSLVVATGGGAVLHKKSFEALCYGAEVVNLTVGTEVALGRLGSDSRVRPLLGSQNPKEKFEKLAKERKDLYPKTGVRIVTDDLTIEKVAEEVIKKVGKLRGKLELTVDISGMKQEILFGEGVSKELGGRIREVYGEKARVLLVVDAGAEVFGKQIKQELEEEEIFCKSVVLVGGETGKTMETVQEIWVILQELKFQRDDVLVAIGGGATLDTAGMAAATYGRGISLVVVPSTYLAMVDAAVGGKVGVNFRGVKNAVGTFYPARLVIEEESMAVALKEKLQKEGLAEAIKVLMGIAPVGLQFVGKNRDLKFLLEQAVRIKAGYVQEDSKDYGVRRALNLGHTLAHGIETASKFEVSHGEAVAMGTLGAARIGQAIGILQEERVRELRNTLLEVGLPIAVPRGIFKEEVARAMLQDKKRIEGELVLVVPSDTGLVTVKGMTATEAMEYLLWE